MDKLNRNEYFDNLKGFLILAVIIGNSLELASPSGANVHFVILCLYIFHMPLFAFVSGYFSKLSRRSTKEKVIDTFKLYLFAQVFYTMFIYFIFGDQTIRFQLVMPHWTLWYLLSLTCWYLLEEYMKDLKKWIPITIGIALLIGFDTSIGTTGSIERTIFFLPCFLLGVWFKPEYIKILKRNKFKLLVISAISIVALFVIRDVIPVELFFEYTNYFWYFEQPWFPFVMRIVHYILAIIVGACVMAFIPEKKTWMKFAGVASLNIYITHSLTAKMTITTGILKYNSLLQIITSTIIYVGLVLIIVYVYRKFIEPQIDRLKKKR